VVVAVEEGGKEEAAEVAKMEETSLNEG